jgi:hypothetical protein
MPAKAMKRSVVFVILSIELSLTAWWFHNIRFEQGVDQLLFHHMAAAINQFGYAPWVVSPLSYLGFYPGSDSSAVPFLAASISELSGLPLNSAILVYDLLLLGLFGLGLFTLVKALTHRIDASLLAMLMGGTSYGFFSTVLWTLDERSFNVALAPILLYLLISVTTRRVPGRGRMLLVLPTVSFLMYAGHLTFLLLIPIFIVLPLVYNVAKHQFAFRRRRIGSLTYMLAAIILPVAEVTSMSLTGLLSRLGLEISLEHSAIVTGNSPGSYLVNTTVFLATRAGPVILALAVVGLLYIGTRRMLTEERVLVNGILLGGLVGLPIIIYSKDLVTALLVIPAAIAIPSLLQNRKRIRTVVVLLVAGITILSGSAAFDAWNINRMSSYASSRYWTSPGLTSEPASTNLWISTQSKEPICLYGNNWLATRFVATEPYEFLCGDDSSVEDLVHMEANGGGRIPIHSRYVGVNGPNPSGWLESPELAQVAADFRRLPSMGYAPGIVLLSQYGVRYVVVSMAKPTQVPLFEYQGTTESRFFAELWSYGYPLYRTPQYAIFAV